MNKTLDISSTLTESIINSMLETVELLEDKGESEYFYLLDTLEIQDLKEVA